MFEITVNSVLAPKLKDPTELSNHLSKSIFVVVVGNNDYLNNYLDPLYLATKYYSPPQFAEFLLHALSHKLQVTYTCAPHLCYFIVVFVIPRLLHFAEKRNQSSLQISCFTCRQLGLVLFNWMLLKRIGLNWTRISSYEVELVLLNWTELNQSKKLSWREKHLMSCWVLLLIFMMHCWAISPNRKHWGFITPCVRFAPFDPLFHIRSLSTY